MARRQFGVRLRDHIHDEKEREKVLVALMEETKIIAENLIVVALEYGHLNAPNLRVSGLVEETPKRKHTIILTEEVD